MKRRGAAKSRINYTEPDIETIAISSEYFNDERPTFICSICNRTLNRLSDAGGNNSTYWCRHCSVEYDPAEENVRRESKLSVPDRNEETLVASTPGIDNNSVAIRKERKLEWGAKELAKKGTIEFTSYEERKG